MLIFLIRHPMVFIFQLIRFARVSSHDDDFNTSNKFLTALPFREGYRCHKIRKAFPKDSDHEGPRWALL